MVVVPAVAFPVTAVAAAGGPGTWTATADVEVPLCAEAGLASPKVGAAPVTTDRPPTVMTQRWTLFTAAFPGWIELRQPSFGRRTRFLTRPAYDQP